MPLAIMAQFTIPPKMFTSIASTCGKEEWETVIFNEYVYQIQSRVKTSSVRQFHLQKAGSFVAVVEEVDFECIVSVVCCND